MKISQINIKNIEKSVLEGWFEQMSAERREAVSRVAVEQKRNLRIAADALCRKTVSEFCSISPADIIFEQNKTGKPFVKGLPVYFSISHSGDYAVCAVSDCEIGIDIEKIRPIDLRVADRFATEKEKEYIHTCKDGFFRIWTLKEAYFKCIGTGIGADIKNVSFDVCENKINCSESGYDFSFHGIDENYICTVCKKQEL